MTGELKFNQFTARGGGLLDKLNELREQGMCCMILCVDGADYTGDTAEITPRRTLPEALAALRSPKPEQEMLL